MLNKMSLSVVVGLSAAVLMTLSGCGQKGPLTLPPPAKPTATAATPVAPAAASSVLR